MPGLWEASDVAARIDHTLLKPEADETAVRLLCEEAVLHGFASVCVNGRYVATAAGYLEGAGVKVCSVVGFPLGAMELEMKAAEAAWACDQGADEIDFVASLPMMQSEDGMGMLEEWPAIIDAARASNPSVVVKVIFETAAVIRGVSEQLAEERMSRACGIARLVGVDYIKTSTGFHPAGGASVEAVSMMKKFGEGLKIKASGGIRTWGDAVAMLDAGADRLGCSASVEIVKSGGGEWLGKGI